LLNYKAVVSWACRYGWKAKLLIDHFGFDHVINYKTTKDINQAVKKLPRWCWCLLW
jgi:NADPH-dependent curcumin reductase CurA